jgi:hypothetical protein
MPRWVAASRDPIGTAGATVIGHDIAGPKRSSISALSFRRDLVLRHNLLFDFSCLTNIQKDDIV